MRAPFLTAPLVAAAPLVGAAAISFPDLLGGPVVVAAVGWFVVAGSTLLPHRSDVFVLAWWLAALASLIPPLLPAVAVPGVGVLRVPTAHGAWLWWAGAALSVAWWWAWFRAPLRDALEHDTEPDDGDPEEIPERPRARCLTPENQPARDVPIRDVSTVPLGPDRYADVTIEAPDDGVDPGGDIASRVAAVWPSSRKRSDRSTTHTCDVARLLGMDERDLLAELSAAGIRTASKTAVPLDGSGGPTGKRALMWGQVRHR